MSTQTLEGFLLIDKPVGPTSHDIVAKVRALLPRGTKVGHAGTLDPLASGLLIIGLGKSTKKLSEYVGLDKTYEVRVQLGATSTTDDGEGAVTIMENAEPVSEAALRAALEKLTGEQDQIPPAFSAKKVDGERLYKLARQGKPVEARPHHINVYSIDLVRYVFPVVELLIHCSSGTYIRSIARDLGEILGVGGFVVALRRTAIGPYMVKNARPPQELTPGQGML